MRMFLLFVLLFIPVTSPANTAPEVCLNIGNDATLCNSTPGCVYNPEATQNKCKQCEEKFYCPNDQTEHQPCPSPFTDSDVGATSADECYMSEDCDFNGSTWSGGCRRYYNNTIVCTNATAHLENNTCYINARNCQKFNYNGCNSGTISKNDILWTNNKWQVADCTCTEQFSDNTSLHCSGKRNKSPTDTSLSDVNQPISYTSADITQYECFSCSSGYYAPKVYNISDSDKPAKCKAFSGQYAVCNCEATPQGTFSENCTWDVVSSGINPCPKNPCPKPGQTTNGVGAGTSVGDCHYSSETKFCDAAGCFTISDAGANNVWNWNY